MFLEWATVVLNVLTLAFFLLIMKFSPTNCYYFLNEKITTTKKYLMVNQLCQTKRQKQIVCALNRDGIRKGIQL